MQQINILIKPASSLCNMRCTYCFYADVSAHRNIRSYGIMSTETADRLVRNVFENLHDGDEITFSFQGGEPTLAGLDFFIGFVSAVEQFHRSVPYHFTIQTNGLLIDESWCRFLAEKKFLTGLSLDGDRQFHDVFRINERGGGTFERIMQTKKLLDRFHVEYNILTVLTNTLADSPRKVWNFIKHTGIRYIQFIPCLDDLEHSGRQSAALGPRQFASFYNVLFPLWKRDMEQGKYISVKFFDDLFNLLTRHIVSACGFTGICQPQLVVEADGSVYPCDFYVLDKWKTGNITTDSIGKLISCGTAKVFTERGRTTSELCKKCSYHSFCGGGCPRMKNSMYLNKKETYCGYRDFLESNAAEIEEAARFLTNA